MRAAPSVSRFAHRPCENQKRLDVRQPLGLPRPTPRFGCRASRASTRKVLKMKTSSSFGPRPCANTTQNLVIMWASPQLSGAMQLELGSAGPPASAVFGGSPNTPSPFLPPAQCGKLERGFGEPPTTRGPRAPPQSYRWPTISALRRRSLDIAASGTAAGPPQSQPNQSPCLPECARACFSRWDGLRRHHSAP